MFYSLSNFMDSTSLTFNVDTIPNLFPEIPSTNLPPTQPAIPILARFTSFALIEDPVGTSGPELYHSTRVRTFPSHLRDYYFLSTIASLHEPQTFRKASSDPLWLQAMKKELDALRKTQTWDLVDLLVSKSAIGCEWIYRIKTCSDNTIDRYKACLIAKRFTQEYGIDNEETFSPVAYLSYV